VTNLLGGIVTVHPRSLGDFGFPECASVGDLVSSRRSPYHVSRKAEAEGPSKLDLESDHRVVSPDAEILSQVRRASNAPS